MQNNFILYGFELLKCCHNLFLSKWLWECKIFSLSLFVPQIMIKTLDPTELVLIRRLVCSGPFARWNTFCCRRESHSCTMSSEWYLRKSLPHPLFNSWPHFSLFSYPMHLNDQWAEAGRAKDQTDCRKTYSNECPMSILDFMLHSGNIFWEMKVT